MKQRSGVGARAAASEGRGAAAVACRAESWEGVDRTLFERLRSLRLDLAHAACRHMSIFHDATLREMARLRPASVASLLTVKGVGARKAEDVGGIFLETIRAHGSACAHGDRAHRSDARRAAVRKARGERWSLAMEVFASTLEASARKTFAASTPDASQLDRYCGRFISRTWRSRAPVHRAAMPHGSTSSANTGRDSIARRMPSIHRVDRDLADSLYGELFGLDVRDGERRSHFRYFHGRSSLSTWLRAVLSRRHVDRLRSARRQDPLPEDEAPGAFRRRRTTSIRSEAATSA